MDILMGAVIGLVGLAVGLVVGAVTYAAVHTKRRYKPTKSERRQMILTAARESGYLEGWTKGADLSVYRLQKILNGDQDVEIRHLAGRIDVVEHRMNKLENAD